MLNPDKIVDLLNEAVAIDKDAIEKILTHRVVVDSKMEDHPTIAVGSDGENIVFGMLGILNGIIGLDDPNKRIAAIWDDKNTRFVGFKLYDYKELFG